MNEHQVMVFVAGDMYEAGLPLAVCSVGIDTEHITCDRFMIDDARALQAAASVRPIAGDVRTFVITARTFTEEAQNALLKLFEEPPVSVQFYVIIPRLELLLPTLRSRVYVAKGAAASEGQSEVFASFLQMTPAERIEHIGMLAKQKDVTQLEELMLGTEHYAALHQHTKPALLRQVVLARSYFGFPGASKKMLLESLALLLPAA